LLRVYATDPAAPIDFEAWCLRRQHQFLACEAQDEGWMIRLKKGLTGKNEI
jgi:TusA-related sulfurtransferase